MYLPTFWKLTMEAYSYKIRLIGGYGLPVGIFLGWIINPSLYNWYYTSICPPPIGVLKKDWDWGSKPYRTPYWLLEAHIESPKP